MRAILVCLTVVFASCITSCQREAAVVPTEGPLPQRQTEKPPPQRPDTTARKEIVGPDGGKMVWVPPGQFKMGAEDLSDIERPVHLVKITEGFWLGKCEVTNAQYRKFCQATGRKFLSEEKDPYIADDYPVVWVSWEDAAAYCQHHGLRLPTEAEWEYAAAGPEARMYPWGDDWDGNKCSNLANPGPGGTTFPVGSFPEGASWCGALDMAGNVFEWCADWFERDVYERHARGDLTPPESANYRVVRGGSWRLTVGRGDFRCAYRNRGIPTDRFSHFGFRCARNP